MLSAPGQWPASDLPPPLEHALVEMHVPVRPAFVLQVVAPALVDGAGPALFVGEGVALLPLGGGPPTSGPNAVHPSSSGISSP